MSLVCIQINKIHAAPRGTQINDGSWHKRLARAGALKEKNKVLYAYSRAINLTVAHYNYRREVDILSLTGYVFTLCANT